MDMVMPSRRCGWIAAWLAITSPIYTAAATEQPIDCSTDRWDSIVREAAQRFDLRPAWVRAVIRVESGGCAITSQGPVTSSAGAMGPMQLMADTWSRLRRQLHLGSDPYDPADNILAGVAYLRELDDAFGISGAFAAYHAGPERYQQWLLAGRPLPDATLDYLDRLHQALARMVDSLLLDPSPAPPWHTPFVDRDAIPHALDRRSLSGFTPSVFVTLHHAASTETTKSDELPDVQP
jgi:Transglycosylase SLT domain